MARQEYDLELRRYDGQGWRAIFFQSGFEHSLTSHAAWARSPWEAVQRAAADALRKHEAPEPGPRDWSATDDHHDRAVATDRALTWDGGKYQPALPNSPEDKRPSHYSLVGSGMEITEPRPSKISALSLLPPAVSLLPPKVTPRVGKSWASAPWLAASRKRHIPQRMSTRDYRKRWTHRVGLVPGCSQEKPPVWWDGATGPIRLLLLVRSQRYPNTQSSRL